MNDTDHDGTDTARALTDEELEQVGSVDIDYIVKQAEGFCDEKTIDILRQYERLVACLLATIDERDARYAALKADYEATNGDFDAMSKIAGEHKAERETLRADLAEAVGVLRKIADPTTGYTFSRVSLVHANNVIDEQREFASVCLARVGELVKGGE